MLHSPWSSGVHVCLRCQARLWQRTLTASTIRKQAAATLTAAARHVEEAEQQQQARIRFDRTYSKDGKGIVRHIHPQGRIRGRKGKEVREDAAQLEIESLGEPSEIIVLREADIYRGDRNRPEPGQEQSVRAREAVTEPDSQGIFESIEDESTTPTQDAVNSDIEALRQQASQRLNGDRPELSEAEAEDVISKLMASYSHQQLRKYVEYLQASQKCAAAESNQLRNVGHVFVRSEWRAGQHEVAERLPPQKSLGQQQKKSLSGRVNKSALVRMIMYNLWDVRVAGRQGDLDLQLLPQSLQLLTAGPRPTALDQISQQHNVTFAVTDQKLRIRGSHRAATDAADTVATALRSVTTRSMNVEGLREWISKCRETRPGYLTRSQLNRLLSQHRVAVDYKRGPPTKTTKRGVAVADKEWILRAFSEAELDDAQQAVLRSIDMPYAGDCTTSFKSNDVQSIPIVVNLHASLYRDYEYFRDTGECTVTDPNATKGQSTMPGSPSNKNGTKLQWTPRGATVESHMMRQTYSGSSLNNGCSQDQPLQWAATPTQHIAATLGLHLHHGISGVPSGKSNQKRSGAKANAPTASPLQPGDRFFPSAPYAIRWLAQQFKATRGATTTQVATKSQLHFTFLPTPFTDVKVAPIATRAPVRLIFHTDPDTGRLSFSEWSAHLGDASLVQPLPQLSSDLRFTKSSRLAAGGVSSKQLRDCVDHVQASIAEGGTLHALPSIQLNTPRVSFAGMENHLWERPWGNYSWTFDAQAGDIEYLFAGVEFRQTLELIWKPSVGKAWEYPLTYTMINAGKMAGQRTELTLHLPEGVVVGEDESGTASQARERFYDAAIELARQVNAAADAGDA